MLNFHRHIKTLSYGCRTVVAVIHQPSHEVFGLCDQLCLLAGGYPVYFGPAPAAAFHFEVAGLMVPDQVSAPDHYLRCINPDFEVRCCPCRCLLSNSYGTHLEQAELAFHGCNLSRTRMDSQRFDSSPSVALNAESTVDECP